MTHNPLVIPKGSLSGHSRPSGAGSESGEEREWAAPKGDTSAGAGGVPGPREDADGGNDTEATGETVESVVQAYVGAYVGAVGVPPRPHSVKRLRTDAAALLAAGRDAAHLEHLAADLAVRGWDDLVKHLRKNPKPEWSAGGRERCADHPARYRAGCMECAMAVPV